MTCNHPDKWTFLLRHYLGGDDHDNWTAARVWCDHCNSYHVIRKTGLDKIEVTMHDPPHHGDRGDAA